MKIAEINGCSIYLLSKERTLIIIEPNAIFFRCTGCGEIKSVHMLTDDHKSLPLMRMCFCGNAPHAGGDTQPLFEQPEPVQEQVQPASPYVTGPIVSPLHIPIPMGFPARLIERDK